MNKVVYQGFVEANRVGFNDSDFSFIEYRDNDNERGAFAIPGHWPLRRRVIITIELQKEEVPHRER